MCNFKLEKMLYTYRHAPWQPNLMEMLSFKHQSTASCINLDSEKAL